VANIPNIFQMLLVLSVTFHVDLVEFARGAEKPNLALLTDFRPHEVTPRNHACQC